MQKCFEFCSVWYRSIFEAFCYVYILFKLFSGDRFVVEWRDVYILGLQQHHHRHACKFHLITKTRPCNIQQIFFR